MTIKYLDHPTPLLTNVTDGKNLTDSLSTFKVILRENAVSIATINIDNNESQVPNDVSANKEVTLKIGDSILNPVTIFKGKVNYPTANYSATQNRATLNCIHSGYGLCDMLVAQSYGTQSTNYTLDNLTDILTDSTYGILPAYVDKILNDTSSGWSLSAPSYINDHVAELTETIRYMECPYKPADKVIDDLIDLVTAIRSPNAGPHWIVDNAGYFRLKLLGTSQTASAGSGAPDWTLWYGGTTNDNGQATIRLGEDVNVLDYQEMQAEGNYIINYGLYRNPGSGDSWTENDVSGWGYDVGENVSLAASTSYYAVGSASLEATLTDSTTAQFRYPASQDAGWDFTKMGDSKHVPTLNFLALRLGINSTRYIKLFTDATHNYILTNPAFFGSNNLPMANESEWYSFSIPVGPYWNNIPFNMEWKDHLADSLDWSEVNWIEFNIGTTTGNRFFIDGLHFGNVPVCRVAWNSDLPTGAARMRFINDMVATDDSLIASDDTGTMAQLVKAEYLRQATTAYSQIVKMPIIPDALPGQQFYLNSQTYRATEVMHEFDGKDMTTTLHLNSDLINGRARKRYDDQLKIYSNFRPSTQDKQATSISRNNVDYRIPQLIKDYAPA